MNGALGGITFTNEITPYIASIQALENYASTISMVIVISIITYLSIIIGELVPKSLAMTYAEPIAISLAPIMNLFRILMHPVVWLLSASTKLILGIFRIKK